MFAAIRQHAAAERVADAMVCTGFNPASYSRNGPYFAYLSDRAQAVRPLETNSATAITARPPADTVGPIPTTTGTPAHR